MSHLAGFNLVFQASRTTVFDQVRLLIPVQQNPLIPPFRLFLPPPASSPSPVAVGKPPLAPIDIIISGADLKLLPGTDTGKLELAIQAGVIRLENAQAVPFQSGKLVIDLEFRLGPLKVRLVRAAIEVPPSPLSSAIADFAAKANTLADSLISGERDRDFDLFPGLPQPILFALVFGGQIRVLNAETIAVANGGEDPRPAELESSIQSGSSVSLALSAGFVRRFIICRSLLASGDRDPALANQPFAPPSEMELGRLPLPCGTGALDRGTDDAEVKITRMDFAFRDGWIDVNGTFTAKNTCWSVSNGRFSQKLYLDFIPAFGILPPTPTGGGPPIVSSVPRILPRLDPLEPHLEYDVSIDFLCHAMTFLLGAFTPIIGGALLGVGLVIAVELGKGIFSPPLQPQTQPPSLIEEAPDIAWTRARTTPEGLILQGSMNHAFPAGASPSALYYDVKDKAVLKKVSFQKGVFGAPTCAPREFTYLFIERDDVKEIEVKPHLLLEPVKYEWTVNNQALTPTSEGTLQFTTTAHTALPPPSGVPVAAVPVQLGYTLGTALALELRPRRADLNYSVAVDIRASDAAGRVFNSGGYIAFEAEEAKFGSDWHDYLDACLRQVNDIVDRKKPQKIRLKPGEPQEKIAAIVQFFEDQIEAGNTQLPTVVQPLVDAHGLKAINEAIARVARKSKL